MTPVSPWGRCMIALDTNVLVYAHRPHFEGHDRCKAAIESWVRSGRRFAIPWPCVHEFLALVTHRRVFATPTPIADATAFVNDFAALDTCHLIGETPRHLEVLGRLMQVPGVVGPRVHDARIAAICLAHGIDELWTSDRDFNQFAGLRLRNPVVG